MEDGLAPRFAGIGATAARPHDWTAFDVYQFVDAAPQEVLRRWRSSAGYESFFVREAIFTDASGADRSPTDEVQAGDRYRWETIHAFRMTGRVLASSPDGVTDSATS